MNLFELFVKIGVDDQASGKLEKLGGKLGKGLQTAAKIGTAAVSAAAAGITALTTAAVKNYAEYEQLVGGVETLFKESADTVKQYAAEAYKSAGLSANQYMQTVTSFSASLLQSTGRGAQTDLEELEKNLDSQYDATKETLDAEYKEFQNSWKNRLALAKEMGGDNYELLKAQQEQELKEFKKANEEKLKDLKSSNESRLKEAENANNMSVQTAESQAEAAKLANEAIVDMSDNANKMGTSMELIQNAYQGFAKQNYTMLDNLKLGYGGTKTEMERLIKDAARLDESVDANDMSFANIVKAIHAVQVEMKISGISYEEYTELVESGAMTQEEAFELLGTTAKEANFTISGSLNQMKASWSNLITGMADSNADFDGLINDFVGSVEIFGNNILPRIEIALGGVVKLIEGLFPKIIEKLPSLINTLLPALVTGALSIVQSFVKAISDNGDLLIKSAIDAVMTLANGILQMLPEIVKLGLDLIVSLALGIAEALPELIPTIIDVVLQIVDTLTNPETLSNLLNAALVLVMALMEGLLNPDSIEKVYNAIFDLVNNIIDFLLDEQNLSKIITAAFQFVIALGMGMLKQRVELAKTVIKLIGTVVESIFTTDWGEVGRNIVDGLLDGLKKAWESLKKWFSNAWDSLVGGVKDLLGIHSPSRVFAGIGKNMALGVGEGWEDEFAKVEKDIDGSMNFDDASYGITTYASHDGENGFSGFGGTSFGDVYINIDGANIQDDETLADTIAEKLQRMTERRGAVYA